jgi:hypothetical protein
MFLKNALDGFKPPHIDYLKTLCESSNATGLLLFGSYKDKNHWKKSDIDLFLFVPEKDTQSAWYTPVDDSLFHVNCICQNEFIESVNKPTYLTFQSLLAKGQILFDTEELWLSKLQNKIRSYPEKNRVLQIIQRLEQAEELLYRIEKADFKGNNTMLLLQSLHETVMQMELIHQGIYFGRSCYDEHPQFLQSLEKLPGDKDIKNDLLKTIRKYEALYLEQFIVSIFPEKEELSITEIDTLTGLDLYHILLYACDLKILHTATKTNSQHGFNVAELVFLRV